MDRIRQTDQKAKDQDDSKKSLLKKLFHDLDIADFLPNRDRGDSKTNTIRQTRILINNHERPANLTQRHKTDKKGNIEITVSEVKPKEIITDKLDTDQQNEDEQKKLQDCKAKTPLTMNSSNKLTVNRLSALQERTRLKPELNRTDDRTKMNEKIKSINEKERRTEQRYRKTDENSKAVESKRNKNQERHDPFKRMEIAARTEQLTKDENCGTEDIADKLNRNTKVDDRSIIIERVKNQRLPPKEVKKEDRNASLKKPFQTSEERKLLRQKYTVKLKNANRNNESKDDMGKGNDNKENISQPQEEPKENHSKEPELTALTTNKGKKPKEPDAQKKPIIKTIRINNDNRVYKAVTFVEDRPPTSPLQIKMPNQKKSVETNTVKNKYVKLTLSKVSMNEKKKQKQLKEKKPRREKVRNRPVSPIFPTGEGCSETEVAKWAPASINQLTKPYYEAWVDTTLTAITKCSQEEKELINKENIIRTFKRAIDLELRPDSPDLVYEKMNDETFMGKITVRQKR